MYPWARWDVPGALWILKITWIWKTLLFGCPKNRDLGPIENMENGIIGVCSLLPLKYGKWHYSSSRGTAQIQSWRIGILKTSIFIMFGFLEPLDTLICEFAYTELLQKIKTSTCVEKYYFLKIGNSNSRFLKVCNLEILEPWNLGNLKSWHLGILKLWNFETSKLWNFGW